MSQAEAQSVVKQITDPGKTWQEKKGILLSLSDTYGKEKMQGILQHLSMEKLPTHYLVAMSTNSANLNEDILAAHSTKDLEKVVKSELPSGTTLNDVRKKISKKIDKWEQVIENQLPGSFDVVEYKKAVEDTLYRAALIRIDRGDGVNDAANSVSKEFLSETKDNRLVPLGQGHHVFSKLLFDPMKYTLLSFIVCAKKSACFCEMILKFIP